MGGGSMRNLLALWRAHGLDTLLIRAWRSGTVLAGLSAGADALVPGRRHSLQRTAGGDRRAGRREGLATVHADGEPERLPVWLAAVKSGS